MIKENLLIRNLKFKLANILLMLIFLKRQMYLLKMKRNASLLLTLMWPRDTIVAFLESILAMLLLKWVTTRVTIWDQLVIAQENLIPVKEVIEQRKLDQA